jgi:ComF family protein
MFKSFINLIYPSCCPACNLALLNPDDFICTHCRYHLPKTNFHLHQINPVHKKFDGRIIVNAATSFLYFFKGGITQELIAKLKYKGRKDVGIFIGELYGYDLLESELFNAVDIIIPVPLHKDKFKKRGYNQSEQFAEGLSNSMKIPTDFNSVIKKTASATQTTKRRYERWKNVQDVYFLNDLEIFKDKHVLLVDDVVTTGSTLEAAATVLLTIPGIKISFATIACGF